MYPSLRRVGCPWVWTLQRNTQDSSALQREDGSVAQHPRFCHRFCMCVPVLSLLQARCMCCVCPGHFLLPLRLTAGLDGCIVTVIVSVHHHCPLVAGAAHGIPAVYLGCVLQGRVCTLLCVCVCVVLSLFSTKQSIQILCRMFIHTSSAFFCLWSALGQMPDIWSSLFLWFQTGFCQFGAVRV